MTIAADGVTGRDPAEFKRWAVCLLIVVALHCASFLLIIRHRVPIQPVGASPAAVIIDLPPAPVAAPPAAAPPAEPTPPEPAPPPPPEPEPAMPTIEPTPAPNPPVVLPAPQPPKPAKPKPTAKPVEHPKVQRPEPAVAPMPAAPATPAPPAAVQAPGPAHSTASARATWQSQLLAWLERYKRYPRVAQEQHQQGVASLRFALDRQGRVLSFRLDKSSGFTLLDEEVLELIQRAQPVPPPPPEIPGDRIEVQVPVAFSLRKGRH